MEGIVRYFETRATYNMKTLLHGKRDCRKLLLMKSNNEGGGSLISFCRNNEFLWCAHCAVDQFFLRVEFPFRPLTFLKNTFRHLPRILFYRQRQCQRLPVVISLAYNMKNFPFKQNRKRVDNTFSAHKTVYRNCDRTWSNFLQWRSSFRVTSIYKSIRFPLCSVYPKFASLEYSVAFPFDG